MHSGPLPGPALPSQCAFDGWKPPVSVPTKHVLLIDDDEDLAPLLREVLTEEGWRVSVVADTAAESVRAAVDRLEPDCILLDGSGQGSYGQSWLEAAAIHERSRPIPVIMFSVDARATDEAQEGTSARSVRAGFAAVLPKPFDLENLVAVVNRLAPLDTATMRRTSR